MDMMDVKLFYGGIFKIVAVHSNKVLDVPAEKKLQDSVPIQQWEANGRGNENQWFMVFPVDDVGRYFVIASCPSGKVLDVAGVSKEEGARILQCSFSGQENQLFELEAVPDKPDTYFIRAKHSGKVLNISGQSHADGAEIIQYSTFPGDQAGNNQFRFEKVDEFKVNAKNIIQDILTRTPVPSPSEFPALTSPQKPQSTTDWKVVGQPFLIPYFMVKDNNELWQIKKSPYYLLTREVRYTLNDEYFCYNNTGAKQVIAVKIRAGFTSQQAESFSTTTGLQLSTTFTEKATTEASAGVKDVASVKVGLETSLSFTASASLNLGYSSSTSLSKSYEKEASRTITVPEYTSLAVWNQTSRFTLKKLDSSVLRIWEVPEEGIFVDDFKIPQ